jgi:hypothetical protein
LIKVTGLIGKVRGCLITASLSLAALTGVQVAMADDDLSPGGSRIHRYDAGPADFTPPHEAAKHIDEISKYLSEFLGESTMVWHEIISDKVHLDIIVFPPQPNRDWWTLVTSGMSDLPMKAPEAAPDGGDMQFAEIVISLPRDWFTADDSGMISDDQLQDAQKFWPIRLIKFLGRLPHDYDTWLWAGHSVPNYDPAEPYADNTAMSGVVLLPPITWAEDKWAMRRKDGNLVIFLAAVPVYEDEMDYKLDYGIEALAEKFDAAGVTETLDIARPSAVSGLPIFRN